MLSPRGNMIRLLRHAVRVRHGAISTELGCRATSDLPRVAIRLRTCRIGSFVA
jgi:hypothetical protein